LGQWEGYKLQKARGRDFKPGSEGSSIGNRQGRVASPEGGREKGSGRKIDTDSESGFSQNLLSDPASGKRALSGGGGYDLTRLEKTEDTPCPGEGLWKGGRINPGIAANEKQGGVSFGWQKKEQKRAPARRGPEKKGDSQKIEAKGGKKRNQRGAEHCGGKTENRREKKR